MHQVGGRRWRSVSDRLAERPCPQDAQRLEDQTSVHPDHHRCLWAQSPQCVLTRRDDVFFHVLDVLENQWGCVTMFCFFLPYPMRLRDLVLFFRLQVITVFTEFFRIKKVRETGKREVTDEERISVSEWGEGSEPARLSSSYQRCRGRSELSAEPAGCWAVEIYRRNHFYWDNLKWLKMYHY